MHSTSAYSLLATGIVSGGTSYTHYYMRMNVAGSIESIYYYDLGVVS